MIRPADGSEIPMVLSSASSESCDDDCACPSVAVSTGLDSRLPAQQGQLLTGQFLQTNETYTQPLGDEHHLALSPFAASGPVVLNRLAWQRWQVFRKPNPLAEPVDRVLYAHRLLQMVEQPYRFSAASPSALTAWLQMTEACNLRCDYCYVSKSAKRMSFEIGQQAIDAIFRSAKSNGFPKVVLKYAGGEPTLNFGVLSKLCGYAQQAAEVNQLELDSVILSNGLRWVDQMIETIGRYRLRVMISLDGLGPSNDRQRRAPTGESAFERIERTLEQLAAAHIQPAISVTVTGRNVDGMPALVGYLLKKPYRFTLNFYRENDCAGVQHDLALNPGRVISALRQVVAIIKANLPPYPVFSGLLDRARLGYPHQYPCGSGNSYLAFDTRGRVAKCHMAMEHFVADAQSADPLHHVRADRDGVQNPGLDEKSECRQCQWRYWCAGGCPIMAHRSTGRYDAKSPNCEIYRALFPELAELEGLRLIKYGSAN
jgi:uncharacterized protein